MKTFLVIISIFITGALVSVFTYHAPVTTEVTLLRDITDPVMSAPSSNEIFSLFDFSNKEKWNGAVFRFLDITDVSLNSVSQISIPPENKWLSNEPERDRQIRKFEDSLNSIVSNTENVGKMHSSVYIPLSRELARLSQSKSQERILIVYSDLMENNPGLSFYRSNEFSILENNPDSIRKTFERWQPLPPLSGIEIDIVYHPKDVSTDAAFKVVSAFYKNMLEQKGARVTISANLAN